MPKGKNKKPSIKKVNGFEINDKNYNLIKVKSNYLNLLSFSIFFTAIIIFLIGYIIYYLNNLKKCRCFQEENNNNVNIDYLIIIEALGIAWNVIILINLISYYMSINKLKSGGYSTKTKIYLYIAIIVYLMIYGFFVHNVFKLSQNVNEDCLCTQHPVRYLLYFQALIIFIFLILMIFGLFLI